MAYASTGTALTMTAKDLALIDEVFKEGIALKKELQETRTLRKEKRAALAKRAHGWHKKLKENDRLLMKMFGDVEGDEESVTVVAGLLDELRQIYTRLGVKMKS